MAKRITLKPHLTIEELRNRYYTCRKPREKVCWKALYLISKGEVAAEAARRVERGRTWITNLARRYNQEGPNAIARKKRSKPLHLIKVDTALEKELNKALRSKPPDGGFWTGGKVAAWITEKTGRKVNRSTGWRALRRLGFDFQTLRSSSSSSSANKRQAIRRAQ